MSATMFTTRLCVARRCLSYFGSSLRLASTGPTEKSSGESSLRSPSKEFDRSAATQENPHHALASQNADDISNNNNNTISSSDNSPESPSSSTPKISNYVRAFEKIDKIGSGDYVEDDAESLSFASLLRKSKLMQIGNPDGRVVLGTVCDVEGNDLYIDFGGKFHCVCQRPSHRGSEYTVGTRVKLKLKDLEMTSAFLGADKHVTLLEADASLIGIHRSSQWTKVELK